MNILDRTISVFSPEKALKRQVAKKKLQIMNSGYSNYGANTTKKSLKGWRWGGGSSKEDIEDNITVLRQRSRDLYMGVPISTSAIKTLRTNVVGAGLVLKPQVDADFLKLSDEEASNLEGIIEREFKLWAESVNCDLARLNNFYELQQLVFISQLMCGDSFALLPYSKRTGMPYDLRIQLIEGDRICNPNNNPSLNIVQGVECDDSGQIVAYHIANFHPLSTFNINNYTWTRVEAFGNATGRRNVLHLMESERIGQRRGIPILAPVMEGLKQLGRYTEAELMAAVISGMFTVFIESENSDDSKPLGEVIDDIDQVDSEDENSYELAPGAIIALGEGEKAKETNPGRPNTAFDGFVNSICSQIGSALEIPHDLLLKQFNASYSASRAALLEAWKMFKMRRIWLANDFCQPIYEEWLSEAVAKGRIYAPGFFDDPIIKKAYCNAEWNGPSQGQLDPVKEANAASIRVENGFSTRARETVELTGGDFVQNNRQRIKEEKMRQELLALNQSSLNNGKEKN
jgi:lambda family phage portal protein